MIVEGVAIAALPAQTQVLNAGLPNTRFLPAPRPTCPFNGVQKFAGDLTHLVVDTHWLPSIIAGTRIGKMLQIAKGWALVNSPLCL